jgi:hypothetical protein
MSDNPCLHRGDEWWVKPDIEIVPDCKDMEIKRLRARVEVLERVLRHYADDAYNGHNANGSCARAALEVKP